MSDENRGHGISNRPEVEEAGGTVIKPISGLQETVLMFCGNPVAVIGAVGITIVLVVSIFGPAVLGADPFEMVGAPLSEPFESFFWGLTFGA